jgi:hypothetical protein
MMTDKPPSSSNPLVDDLIVQAAKALDAGNTVEARRLTARAISLDPRSEAAWWQMALSVEDMKQLRDCLHRVLDINPNHAEARQALELVEKSGRANLRELTAEPAAPPSVSPFVEEAPAAPPPLVEETPEDDLREAWSVGNTEEEAVETTENLTASEPAPVEAAPSHTAEPTVESAVSLRQEQPTEPPVLADEEMEEEEEVPNPSPYMYTETIQSLQGASAWLKPAAPLEETIKPERVSAPKQRVNSLGIWISGILFAVSLAVMGYGAYQLLMQYLGDGTLPGDTNTLLQSYGVWLGMFVLGLILSILFFNLMMNGIDRVSEAHVLERTGKNTKGKIINQWEEEGEAGKKQYFVAYQFELQSRTGETDVFRLKQLVKEKAYAQLKIGTEVRVRYLPEDPNTARMV